MSKDHELAIFDRAMSSNRVGVTALAGAMLLMTLSTVLPTIDAAADQTAASADVIAEGKKIAWDRKKGNCLACHVMAEGSLPGNAGPALVAMKQRFPDFAVLRAQIWDSTQRNPNTVMPPFGRHGILTDEEIDKVAAYVHTL